MYRCCQLSLSVTCVLVQELSSRRRYLLETVQFTTTKPFKRHLKCDDLTLWRIFDIVTSLARVCLHDVCVVVLWVGVGDVVLIGDVEL